MKKIIFLLPSLIAGLIASSQNVGIGIATPLQKLHVEGASFLNGNVGIGHSTPMVPLSFNGDLGDKISLWTDGTPTHYGFGIQPGVLQMFSKTNLDDIAFGFGSSNSFVERVRIINTGEMGLQILGRMVLRNGTNPIDPNYGPGIWLTKADNSALLGFIGTQNNQNMGFFGGPGGWGLTYDAINSRVGIGITTPNAKLSISNDGTELAGIWASGTFRSNAGVLGTTTGSELSLANIGFLSSNNSSLGIRAFRNSTGTNWTTTTLLIGYDVDNNVRVGGGFIALGANGNIGIGSSNPEYQLDINNRIRIRSGGNNSVSAGIWLNDNGNYLASFIGMEDDTHVGFYGIGGAGWKFGMNTLTGALKINGTEGQPGQVLISNGTIAAAGYTTIGNVIGTSMKKGFGDIDLLTLGSENLMSNLSHSIVLTRKSRLIISAGVSFQQVICIGCSDALGNLRLKVNGILQTDQAYSVGASSYANASISNFMVDLNAGTHTIEFFVHYYAGPQHYGYPKHSSVIIVPID